jgi:outer membrane protein assembly factor BamB
MQNGISQTSPQPPAPVASEPRPRLWPGVAIVGLYWLCLKVPGLVVPGTMMQFYMMGLGTFVAVVLFIIWWLFFSRVRWAERFAALLAFAAIGCGMWFLYHPTMQGMDPATNTVNPQNLTIGLQFNILPVVLTGWLLWLLVARSLGRQVRLAGVCVVFLLTWGAFIPLRFDGVTGKFSPEFSYRWGTTAEDRYLAKREADKLAASSVADAASGPAIEVTPADWPGFRGADRDGRRAGVRINTDWARNPPKQVWHKLIGPGWGSFAAVGSRLYTQEQAGDVERVVCLDADTGKEIWGHVDATKHQDNESGKGPRATPTFSEGRVYALGATGKLNCLDAATGKSVWARDVLLDSGRDKLPPDKERIPHWGFSASPLVAHGLVTVLAGGPDSKSVLAYHADTGKPAWAAGNGTNTYSSTQLAKIDGVEQLLAVTGEGMTALDPESGKVLWDYDWSLGEQFNRVTQPALVGDSDVLIGSGFGIGTRRVHVNRKGSDWKTDQVWETRAISPYYNDLVVHKGHLYGFHSIFLTCVDLETGKAAWKERGYANGQALLLPDQDLLLVMTESGDVALVEARPDARKELGRFHVWDGKTWNHPVVARGKLFVRNGEEAACFDLSADAKAVAAK